MRTMRLEIAGEVARLTLDRSDILNAGNREWVRDYYQRAYVQSIHGLASAGNLAQ